MKVVVDTNVIAYFLLDTEPFAREAKQFWQWVEEPLAPAVWEAELANVVWMAVRKGIVAPEEGLKRLDRAARLHIRSVSIRSLWNGAVAQSVSSGVSVYDTLFVELAVRSKAPLATYDAAVLGAFRGVAQKPSAILRKASLAH